MCREHWTGRVLAGSVLRCGTVRVLAGLGSCWVLAGFSRQKNPRRSRGNPQNTKHTHSLTQHSTHKPSPLLYLPPHQPPKPHQTQPTTSTPSPTPQTKPLSTQQPKPPNNSPTPHNTSPTSPLSPNNTSPPPPHNSTPKHSTPTLLNQSPKPTNSPPKTPPQTPKPPKNNTKTTSNKINHQPPTQPPNHPTGVTHHRPGTEARAAVGGGRSVAKALYPCRSAAGGTMGNPGGVGYDR